MSINGYLKLMFISLLSMGVFLALFCLIGCNEINNLPLQNVVQIKCEVSPAVYYSKLKAGEQMGKQTGEQKGWQGSGVFIEDDLILTAGHIVDSIESATIITVGGKKYEAESWYLESEADIGFIKVKTPERESRLRFDDACLGETVWAFGNPLGVFPILSKGIVSAINSHDDFQNTKDMVVTDTAINGGNSGCPLFDVNGNIVGICSWGYRGAQGMSYFVDSDIILLSFRKYKAVMALEEAK